MRPRAPAAAAATETKEAVMPDAALDGELVCAAAPLPLPEAPVGEPDPDAEVEVAPSVGVAEVAG